MVRSFANTKVVDSLDKTDSFNSLAYESLRDRCLSIAQQFLMTDEQEKLPLSSICISLIQSIRFLTDYLNSDVYYQVEHSEQNFDRASNQFSFFKEIKDYLSL